MTQPPEPPNSDPPVASLVSASPVATGGQSVDMVVKAESPVKVTEVIKTDKALPVIQEETRGQLAKLLLWSYFAVLALVIVQVISGWFLINDPKLRDPKFIETQNQYAKDLITLVLTSATGILGTAVGFYFGKQDSK